MDSPLKIDISDDDDWNTLNACYSQGGESRSRVGGEIRRLVQWARAGQDKNDGDDGEQRGRVEDGGADSREIITARRAFGERVREEGGRREGKKKKRERERERERERGKKKNRETDRQTVRQTDGDKETDR